MAAKKNTETQPSYKELSRALKEQGPQNLYLLYGAEDYLTESFAEQIRKSCVTAETEDFDAKRLEGPGLDLNELTDALSAIPFFGERTLVELHGVDISKCTDEHYQNLFADIPEWCTVVITLPPEGKPDSRTGIVKLIKQKGCVVEFTAQPEKSLFEWLQKRFAACGKRIGRPAMERLLFLSGELMTRLVPEIEKVAAYAAGEEITVGDVEAVAHHIPEASAFEMADSIASGSMDRAAALLGELLSGGEEPIMVTAILGSQYRSLYAARLAMDRGLGDDFVTEVTGKRGYALNALKRSARSCSLEELRRDVRLCAETDYLLKSDNTTTDSERMAELLIRLAMNGKQAVN